MVNLNLTIEIIPFSVNGLNTIIKSQGLSHWIKTIRLDYIQPTQSIL